jgi:hypothetical protein
MQFPIRANVIKPYQAAYPDPICVQTGEVLQTGRRDDEWPGWVWCTDPRGKSGWAPEELISIENGQTTAAFDYDARELSAISGERVELLEFRRGWYRAVKADGQSGWLPQTVLALLT